MDLQEEMQIRSMIMTTDRISALFLDQDYVKRKLRAMQNAYDKYEDLAAVHGGPAVIETFGEEAICSGL